MCDFEDTDVISTYTRQQAVDDGVLVEILRWYGLPVMATAHVRDAFGLSELFTIWREFQYWKDNVEQTLPEEGRLFSVIKNNKKIWVMENPDGYTIMYPEDY